MKFNILQSIDLKLINEAVEKYESEYPPAIYMYTKRYIIMSDKTRSAVIDECNKCNLEFGLPMISKDDDGKGCEYQGMRIAIDNCLEFGEIDIR